MTIAYWCIFVAGILPVLIVFIAKSDKRLDIHNPRDVHAAQTGIRKRAYGAHLNGLEAFPLFAAAVIVAALRHAPEDRIDSLALVWVAVRLLYTGAYLADLAKIRPALWLLSVLLSVTIFLVTLL